MDLVSADSAAKKAGAEDVSKLTGDDFMSCVHCGLCTSACPTYRLKGDENEGPRGRIHLMRAVTEGRLDYTDEAAKHLDSCLDCRACETACPSGVPYGRLIESFRFQRGRRPALADRLLLRFVFPKRRVLKPALMMGRIAERVGVSSAAERLGVLGGRNGLFGQLRRMLPRRSDDSEALKFAYAPEGESRGVVWLFRGCVSDIVGRNTHIATAKLACRLGYEVRVPTRQGCCGAVAFHGGITGDVEPAVDRNARAFADSGQGAILVNAAGCGAFLNELPEAVLAVAPGNGKSAAAAESLARRAVDVTEFFGSQDDLSLPQAIPLRVAYQAACHLHHAQAVVDGPQRLLRRITELEVCEPVDAGICCGAAGTYNLTHPETSRELARRKVDALLADEPDMIATANVGCRLQLDAELRDRGLDVPVVHPVELLAHAAGAHQSAAVVAVQGNPIQSSLMSRVQ